MRISRISIVYLFVLAGLLQSPVVWSVEVLQGPTLTMDPNLVTPLAGVIEMTVNEIANAHVTISDGNETWTIRFPGYRTDHTLPILGLKSNSAYTLDITLTDQAGNKISLAPSLQATTGPLPEDFPIIEVFASNPDKMEPGFTLLDRFRRSRADDPTLEEYSIIFNSAGEVVWYTTLGGSNMRQLANGILTYRSGSNIIEQDMLGNFVTTVTLADPGLGLHHDLFPTVHGTYLSLTRETVTVSNFPTSDIDPNAPTQTADVRDEPIVEFSSDGSLLNVWRLTDMIDTTRIGYDSLSTTSAGIDWAHTNAVLHDPGDDSIIVSIRHQDAVIKFSRATGDLIWILGTHENWSQAFQPYLLTPVGLPFEWQYHEHAPMITPAGTLLLFDNGNERASPFDGTVPVPREQNYSRAVEYAIDESTMEIRQVWEYGTNAVPRLYSSFISDADWLPVTGNILIDFGGVSHTDGAVNSDIGLGGRSTRIVEVVHSTPAEKVFDVRLHNPNPTSWIATYRSERIPSLYPPSVSIVAGDDTVTQPRRSSGSGSIGLLLLFVALWQSAVIFRKRRTREAMTVK